MIDHFIDNYSKLLIGVVSLTAPITSYLLTNYIKDRTKLLNKLSEQDRTAKRLMLDDQMAEAVKLGKSAIDFVNQTNKQLRENDNAVRQKIKMLKYLEPKKRICWILIPLFISLFLLFLDLLVRDNAFSWYNHSFSMCLLSLSCSVFIFVMITFFYLILQLIDAKEILKQDELDLILEEKSINVETEKPNK